MKKVSVILFLIIFTGCASVKVIDNVPSGTPRGYVEFYFLKNESRPGRVSVYSILNNKEHLEGLTSFWDLKNKVGLLLSKKPGYYTFMANLGGPTVTIHIEEGMVVPVRLKSSSRLISSEKTLKGYKTVESSKFLIQSELIPEDPVPYTEYMKK